MDDSQPRGMTTRRRFLLSAGLLGVGGVLAACSQAAPPPAAPTAAPAAAKPAATTAPAAAAPTTAPAAAAPTTAPAAAPTTAPAAAAPTSAPAAATGGALKDVPRSKTLLLAQGGTQGKFLDYDLWNAYALGANHQTGPNLTHEPLAYYSAYGNKEYLWLASGYEYSPDFKQLTIKLRSGVKWSDGEPFSADDVVYTLSTLNDLGAKVRWGVDIQQAFESVAATDANTVVLKFKVPAPRFFDLLTYKYDIGVYMVPKHIFSTAGDWANFKFFDIAKGWPVTTGPWKIVAASAEQKVFDLRDSWWAVTAGLTDMPKVQRMIYLPITDQTAAVQALDKGDIDYSGGLIIQNIKEAVKNNPKVVTHSGRQGPYGYKDWWPLSLYVNCSVEPFKDPAVRWALSYYIDRQQLIDVAYGTESGIVPTPLPMPQYPALLPYFDAVKDLLDQYPTNAFDKAKGDALLSGKGWKKGGDGIWVDPQGNPAKWEILGHDFLSNVGPVVQAQLKKAGIDATWTQPPDADDRFQKADYQLSIYGHGGSIQDPYNTLNLYTTANLAVPGAHQANFPRWTNADYDKIATDMYLTAMTDKAKLTDLFHKAMEIWLPELPDIQLTQFYHNIGMNTEHWTGWPSDDNPYVNEASWHLTWQLVLNKIQPTA
ncbi:MAG TPA: ABC transporter substrate-binding protein [Chloroflexota bacterium]|nr:ABC transporter substrate-binding protein [Chloroflexota bacterium]